MSLATTFLSRLGRRESCFKRPGGLRGLFGGSRTDDRDGKGSKKWDMRQSQQVLCSIAVNIRRPRRAKLRIDNLADMNGNCVWNICNVLSIVTCFLTELRRTGAKQFQAAEEVSPVEVYRWWLFLDEGLLSPFPPSLSPRGLSPISYPQWCYPLWSQHNITRQPCRECGSCDYINESLWSSGYLC